ncbi:MAG: FtsH protease activity modulator HflK [Alphaproteobacteria bacterium]|nr:FtsH protease activity modulator HflK [Alphaproteobacteria bacterium]MBE8220608.1 FtsH protease activity modulator HflK [Alphaproteobacteria bacterium]
MSWNNQNPWGNSNGKPNGGGGGRAPRGGGGGAPEFDNIVRELRTRFGGGGSPLGGKSGFTFIAAALLLVWGLSGFYRVQADEQGVVLRFGAFHAQTSPGLNYHLPYPIETVLTPKVTIVNRVDVGIRGTDESRNVGLDVPEESLMLTGDENIVDVDFSVFWLINDASQFLFNIQNPTGTVKAVAESTMREIVGQNDIQPILTEQRQKNEEQVRDLMQRTLDSYGAGIGITQVKMQKVDPPAAVIDAFRDVQAARADQERARNEANSYANRVVPEAQGDAERIRRDAEAYRAQTIAEADGEAGRFAAIYSEYEKARGVTRQRMFLETLERVLSNTNKIIIEEGSGIVPYLPLDQLRKDIK